MTITPIPERALLLHIGPYKTGTTALQHVAADQRPALLEHGVLYPGNRANHRLAVNAFTGRGAGWTKPDGKPSQPPPPMKAWNSVRKEIEAEHDRRIWFGHENISMVDTTTAQRFLDEFGPRTEVVITLRPYSRMLGSLWQESLKRNAGRRDLEGYLRKWQRMGTDDLRHDPAKIIRRWSEVAGPEHVRVVILDSQNPDFLYEAFEKMLDLPEGLLVDGGHEVVQNRSMTVAEAEMMRRLNMISRDLGFEWTNHEWLIYGGAIARLQKRVPAADEDRIQLPEWALEEALEHDREIRDLVLSSGVTVVGEPDNLLAPAPKAEYLNPNELADVPMDVAVQAMLGVMAAATGRNAQFLRKGRILRTKLRVDTRQNYSPTLRVLAEGVQRRVLGTPRRVLQKLRG